MSPDYRYRGTGRSLTPAEVAAKLTGAPGVERGGVDPALATSREARADVPAPAIIRGTVVKAIIRGTVVKDAPAIGAPPEPESAPELTPEWRERMASVLEPARCRGCGYRLAKCDCEARFHPARAGGR